MINIIFDGPPSHESGRFVEVENDKGQSIKVGEWVEREGGYWALRIPLDRRQGNETWNDAERIWELSSPLGHVFRQGIERRISCKTCEDVGHLPNLGCEGRSPCPSCK